MHIMSVRNHGKSRSPAPPWATTLPNVITSPPLHLRRRTEGDCETIVSWIDNAADLYLFSGPRLQWPLDSTQLLRMDQIVGLTAWVLVDDKLDDVVGHFDVAIDHGAARLGRVIIDPLRRGQGLSRILVDQAIAQARRFGASSLSLNVIAGNDRAVRAYERAGFHLVADHPRPDVRTMTLPLSAAQ